MQLCEAGEMPWMFDDGYGGEHRALTPGEACANGSQIFGEPSVLSYDVPMNWCTIKWPNGDYVIGAVEKICNPPPIDFDALGITPESMSFVWAWGVAAVLGLWLVGYVIGIGTQAINKA